MLLGILGFGFWESLWLGIIVFVMCVMYLGKKAASNGAVQRGAMSALTKWLSK